MIKKPGASDDFVFGRAPAAAVPVAGTGRWYPVHRIYCIGRNYGAHTLEMGASLREPPFFFSKPADAVFTGETVPFPGVTVELHHEAELVVALGSGGNDVAAGQALQEVEPAPGEQPCWNSQLTLKSRSAQPLQDGLQRIVQG